MATYVDIQTISSKNPIQDYEIETKIDNWKRRHKTAHILKTITKKIDSNHSGYAILIMIKYQANSGSSLFRIDKNQC